MRLDDLKARRDEAKSDLETEREARRRLQRTLKETHPNRQRFAILILHLDAEVFLVSLHLRLYVHLPTLEVVRRPVDATRSCLGW